MSGLRAGLRYEVNAFLLFRDMPRLHIHQSACRLQHSPVQVCITRSIVTWWMGVQGPKGQMTIPIPRMVEIRQVQKLCRMSFSRIKPQSKPVLTPAEFRSILAPLRSNLSKLTVMQAENTIRVFKTEESRTANCRHGLTRYVSWWQPISLSATSEQGGPSAVRRATAMKYI